MRKRLTKAAGVLGALAALAFGGATLASAGSKAAPPPPVVSQTQGDQSAPDTQGAAENQAADTDNLQQGDQSSPDNGTEQGGSESEAEGSESESAEAGQSDRPGGYADASANADTQQQGEH
jgi:hypothetical protein